MIAVRDERIVSSLESNSGEQRNDSSSSSSEQSSQKSIKIILHKQQPTKHQLKQQQQDDETRSENEKVSAQSEANEMMIQSQPLTKSDQTTLKQPRVSDANDRTPQPPISSVTTTTTTPVAMPATTAAAASSLRSTSARIQQRQQRFLAAAAKSATSPTSSDIISGHFQQQLSRLARHSRQVANTRAANGQSMVATKMTTFEKSNQPTEATPLADQKAPSASSSSSVRAKSGAGAKSAIMATDAANCSLLSAQNSLIVVDGENKEESRDRVSDFNAADSSSDLTSTVAAPTTMAPSRWDKASVTGSGGPSEKENLTSGGGGAAAAAALVAPTATATSSENDGDLIERKQQQRSFIRAEGGFTISRPQHSTQTNNKPINTTTYTTNANNYHHNNYNSTNNFHHQQYQNHHHQHQNQQQNQHQHQQHHHQNISNNHYNNINISTSGSSTTTMSHYKFHTDCQSSVLTYEQVKRLDFVMDQTVPIHGRGNFPTLYVKLKELIRLVKHKLQKEHSIEIRDVILNGGAASYVLAPENSHYNDLDLIFGADLSNEDQFDVIRDVVLDCLKEFYPKEPTSRGNRCGQTMTHHMEGESQLNGTSTASSGGGSSKRDQQEDGEREKKIKQTCDISTEQAGNIQKNGPDEEQQANKHKRATKESENAAENHHHHNRTGCEQQTNNKGPAYMGSAKQQQIFQMPPNNCAIKEAYVHKMVKVNDDDRWSLISLGVQQSEVNCGQVNGGSLGLMGLSHCVSEQYFPALPSTIITKNLQDRCDANCKKQQQTGLGGGERVFSEAINIIDAQQVTATNPHQNFHHLNNHQQPTYHYQHQQQHRPKQFPNSIELKFVDRMRRKFEFSVDSFQIILDSLIQFYDYAPNPSIASQRDLMSSHPSSTVINTRPMIMSKRRCSADCCSMSADCMALMESNFDGYNKVRVQRDSFSGITSSTNCHSKSGQCQHHSSSDNEFNMRSKGCAGPLADSRSYYEFQLDANPPSLTSEASSSGCSSSSSVVSSFSSSLSSCDEDHEDLYCDVDGQSSSSASTSSLLSSSVYSSDGGVVCSSSSVPISSSPDQQRPSSSNSTTINSSSKSKKQGQSNKGEKTSHKKTALAAKSKSTATSKNVTPPAAADELVGGCCAGICCLGPTSNYDDLNEYDFETDDSISCAVISENFYPTVIGRSEYGNFKEALYHLEKKLIATRSPEEIRGGGLLKYCNLLVKNYKPTNVYQIRTLERYMCSRFFIDFSDLNQQQAKLESYLANHFSDDLMLKIDYLTILHNVVQRSTVCLMNHELRLTLEMIKDMAFKMNDQQQQQQQRQGHMNQLHQQLAAQSHDKPTQAEMAAVSVTRQQHQQQVHPKQFFTNQHTKPLLIQSGVYRVKLVNYSLAKPAAAATTTTTTK